MAAKKVLLSQSTSKSSSITTHLPSLPRRKSLRSSASSPAESASFEATTNGATTAAVSAGTTTVSTVGITGGGRSGSGSGDMESSRLMGEMRAGERMQRGSMRPPIRASLDEVGELWNDEIEGELGGSFVSAAPLPQDREGIRRQLRPGCTPPTPPSAREDAVAGDARADEVDEGMGRRPGLCGMPAKEQHQPRGLRTADPAPRHHQQCR